jgi:hypothetical protein
VNHHDDVAETISRWARERGIQRLRSNQQIGYPNREHLLLWSGILQQRAIAQPEEIFGVLDAAVVAASRSGEWRNWAFLTLQVQLAAERGATCSPVRADSTREWCILPDEDPNCDWAIANRRG